MSKLYIAFVLLSIVAIVIIACILIGAGNAEETEALGAKEESVQLQMPEQKVYIDQQDVSMLARLIWIEARGVKTTDEKAAVVWCVLNRVDSDEYPDTVAAVISQKNQFADYDPDYPETEEDREIAEDVLNRWLAEKDGEEDVGRVLPKEYVFFAGDGYQNYYFSEWNGDDYWDWSLPSPYDN